MSIKPVDLLNFAQGLLGAASDDEAVARTVANRAYYASFLMCRPLADQLRICKREASHGINSVRGHERCHLRFSDNPVRELKSIGYILAQMKNRRVDADYAPENDFEQAYAEEAVKTAERLFAQVDAVDWEEVLRVQADD